MRAKPRKVSSFRILWLEGGGFEFACVLSAAGDAGGRNDGGSQSRTNDSGAMLVSSSSSSPSSTCPLPQLKHLSILCAVLPEAPPQDFSGLCDRIEGVLQRRSAAGHALAEVEWIFEDVRSFKQYTKVAERQERLLELLGPSGTKVNGKALGGR